MRLRRRQEGPKDALPSRADATPNFAFTGMTPCGATDLYEFALASGGLVHLHDGACTNLIHEPLAARLTLGFTFEPQWAPAGHPGGCVVWLTFEQAAITSWTHEPSPAQHAGQCSGFERHAGDVFTLELLNDTVTFSAHGVAAHVEARESQSDDQPEDALWI